MIEYTLKRCEDRAIIFAKECDYISQIVIDTGTVNPEDMLRLFRTNQVAPEHMQSVYEDICFLKHDES